jgi:26S proteasome regulatory subunit N6
MRQGGPSSLDIVCSLAPTAYDMQTEICEKIILWCQREKRSFLRQRVEAKLAAILFYKNRFKDALELIDRLLSELKKIDDKQLLVETHLLEAKIHFGLRNVPKAKAALTASRTCANAIYVAPNLQASMDTMSGTIHTEEGDYNTAHSYFLEAFEQLDQMNEQAKAVTCLKYMMLCRILDSLTKTLKLSAKGAIGANKNATLDISTLLTSRQAVKYAGRDLEAMDAIAKAATKRSLTEFETVLKEYAAELQQDLLIKHHLDILQEQLLESNLIRIIEPYSCVELLHVAELMELDLPVVEKKLSQMILDGKFQGILDQGKGQLVVYEEGEKDGAMEKGLQVLENMDEVVTTLFERSKALRTLMI